MTDRPDDDTTDGGSPVVPEPNDVANESSPDNVTDLPQQIDVIRTLDDTVPRRIREEGERPPADAEDRIARTRKRQRAVRILASLVLVVVAYYAISVVQVVQTGQRDERDPVDAIVVMGAAQFDGRPSPQLAARLDHVLVLWPDNVAPLVVTTGGNLPGDRFTEAESSANYLIDGGVPEDAILLEDEGGSTYESLESVAAMLNERGLESIVIVTDPYHAKRSQLIAESFGLDANVSSTQTSVVTGSDLTRRYLTEGGGIAIGRIIGYERLDSWTN